MHPLPPTDRPSLLQIPSTVRSFRDDVVGMMLDGQKRHGDVFMLDLRRVKVVFAFDPESVSRIFIDNAENYRRSSPGWEAVRGLLGQGLLTAEGEVWKRQRRMQQPFYRPSAMPRFFDAILGRAEACVARWSALANSGQAIDLEHEMVRLVLETVSELLFTSNALVGRHDVVDALKVINEYPKQATNRLVPLPLWVPTPLNVRTQEAVVTLRAVSRQLIDERRRSGDRPSDLLSALLDATDPETGRPMSDEQIEEELLTMVVAGHETTGILLTYLWLAAIEQPAEAARVRAELDQLPADRLLALQDLRSLVRLDAFVKETLRFRPPAFALDRVAAEDDVLGGYRVPKGAVVVMSAYVTHRSRAWWHEPERFNPERFLAAGEARRHKLAYFPFGAGSRVCIGNNLAAFQASVTFGTLLRKFNLELASHRPIRLTGAITLRPAEPIMVRVTRRPPLRVASEGAYLAAAPSAETQRSA